MTELISPNNREERGVTLREKLKIRDGERMRFKGTFARYGLKTAYKGLPLETVCLNNVQVIQGEEVTDHLWFNHTKGFKDLGILYPGDIIAFDARVGSYFKGYIREEYDLKEVDYHLTRPTKLVLLARVARRKIYNVCDKCGYANRIDERLDKKWVEHCRRCGTSFEEQLEAPKVVDPKLRQRTFEEEFTSIMKSIGVVKE